MRPRTIVSITLTFLSILLLPLAAGAQQPVFSSAGIGSCVAGDIITLPLMMHTSGAEVCAISADVMFDASALQWVGAQAGPAGSAAGKNATFQPMGAGQVRMLLIGMNQNRIADGTVFLMQFRIQAGASGSAMVQIACGAANCTGADYPRGMVNAAVSIAGSSEPPDTPDEEPDAEEPAAEEPSGSDEGGTASGTSTDSGASSGSSAAGAAEADPEPLEASFASVTPKQGEVPLNVALRVSISGGVAPYTLEWDFDDGTEAEEYMAFKTRVIHTYLRPGRYEPEVKVEDSEGSFVHVEPVPVTFTAPPDPVLTEAFLHGDGDTVNLDITGEHFPSGCTVFVNGEETEAYQKGSTRFFLKGLSFPEGEPVWVYVLSPTGQKTEKVRAAAERQLDTKEGGDA